MDWAYHFTIMDGKGEFGQEEQDALIDEQTQIGLEMNQPLWKAYIITNCAFEDDAKRSSCLIWCADHAIADGIGFISILKEMVVPIEDGEKVANKNKNAKRRRRSAPRMGTSLFLLNVLKVPANVNSYPVAHYLPMMVLRFMLRTSMIHGYVSSFAVAFVRNRLSIQHRASAKDSRSSPRSRNRIP